ncbi:MAG: 30S ribosomal protein S5 [Nanoarchaeota archaeon]|nr:30S ribosomal protein S5 [Nanoarchaeota archaeon]
MNEETNRIWKPKTELGRKVFEKELKDIDEILNKGQTILESEIVDNLLTLESDLLLIGQSKGKFGGGQRRIFRQTQKKTREGNKPKFTTMAVVGDKNGHLGIGYGKSKETVPAREKAKRKAKLNIFKIRRGCGSWQCSCNEPHSIPFSVEGKCGSVKIKLIPAPKGKGLCIENECAKVLSLAGIKDVWSKTEGQTKNKINLILACELALKKLLEMKIQTKHLEELSIMDGSVKKDEPEVLQDITEEKSAVNTTDKKEAETKNTESKSKSKEKTKEKTDDKKSKKNKND